MNNENLQIIADEIKTNVVDLESLVGLLQPDVNMTAAELAIERLARLEPYLGQYWEQWFNDEQRNILNRIIKTKSIWSSRVKRTRKGKRAGRCLLSGGGIGKYPLYAAFLDMAEGLEQDLEEFVYPFLALLLIGARANVISPQHDAETDRNLISVPEAGLCVRELCNPNHAIAQKLKAEFIQHSSPKDIVATITKNIENKAKFQWAQKVLKITDMEKFGQQGLIKQFDMNPKEEKERRPPSSPIPLKRGPSGLSKIGYQTAKKPWKNQSVDSEGLSPEENGTLTETIEAKLDAPVDIELEARRFSNFTPRENQDLLWSARHLNQFEAAQVHEQLNFLSEDDPELALLVSLGICTGRPCKDVLEINIFNDISDLDVTLEAAVCIVRNQGLLIHPAFKPQNRYKPDEGATQFLVETQENVTINLPTNTRALIENVFDGKSHINKIRDAIQLAPYKSMSHRLNKWIKSVRKDSGISRFSEARLYNYGIRQLSGLTQDYALVAHVYWVDTESNSQPYYAVFSSEQIQNAFNVSVNTILGETSLYENTSYFVGSKFLVKTHCFKRWIKDWESSHTEAMKKRDFDQLIHAQNSMAKYTLAMLNSFSTQRSISDPFENVFQIDSKSKTALCRDKLSGKRNTGRLTWLIEEVITQVELYKKHLQGLASRLVRYDYKLSNRIYRALEGKGNLPFFFFLKKHYTGQNTPIPVQIRRDSLKNELNLPFSFNFCRSFLRTELVKRGVPCEYVNYQLGHGSAGQEFDDDYSELSVEEVGNVLRTALRDIWHEMGWKNIKGLDSYKQKEKSRPIKQTVWTLGAEKRFQDRQNRKKRLIRKLEKILDNFSGIQILDATTLEKIKERIQTDKSTRNRKSVLAYARKRIKKRWKDAATLIDEKWPKIANPPQIKPSKFNLHTMFDIQKGRRLRSELREWIMTRPTSQNTIELKAISVASAILYGALVRQSLVEQFIDQPVISADGHAWMEMHYENNEKLLKRFFPETITLHLLGNISKSTINGTKSRWSEIKNHLLRKLKLGSMDELFSAAKALYLFEVPIVLFSYLIENFRSVSIPQKDLLRLISGKKLDQENIKFPENSINPPSPQNTYKTKDPVYKTGKKWVRQLQGLIHDAHTSHLIKNRSQLVADIKIQLHHGHDKPIFCRYYLEFVLQLLEHGRRKDELVISSVRTYMNSFLNQIHEATWNFESIIGFTSDDYEILYRRILDMKTENQQVAQACLLEDFHNFLVEKYTFPEVDFAEIEPRAKLTSVKAKLVSNHELELLACQSTGLLNACSVFSIAGAMRVGEISTMLTKHIKLESGSFLTIESTAGSRTKTKSGLRKIPLLGLTSTFEQDHLRHLKTTMDSEQVNKVGKVLSDSVMNQHLFQIRRVTGDNDLVMYSLRHTSISRLVNQFMWPEPNNNFPGLFNIENMMPTQSYLKNFFFSHSYKTRRTSWQIANQAGHSNPSMTFAHYVHVLDFIVSQVLNELHVNDTEFISFLSGLTRGNLRTIKSRKPDTCLGREINSRLLKKVEFSTPNHNSMLITQNLVCKEPYRTSPDSLTNLFEAIKLHQHHHSCAYISELTGFNHYCLERWLNRIKDITYSTGFEFNATFLNRSWLKKNLSPVTAMIEREICSQDEISETLVTIIDSFKRFYLVHESMLYFPNTGEAEKYIKSLFAIGIFSDQISVLVHDHKNFINFHQIENILNITTTSNKKAILSRSWEASQRPGIGIKINGSSTIDRRYSLQEEMFHVLGVALCLIGDIEK